MIQPLAGAFWSGKSASSRRPTGAIVAAVLCVLALLWALLAPQPLLAHDQLPDDLFDDVAPDDPTDPSDSGDASTPGDADNTEAPRDSDDDVVADGLDAVGRAFRTAIRILISDGVADACEPVESCWDVAMTRLEVAVWITRALEGTDPEPIELSRFADIAQDSWGAQHVERVAELGITRGCAQQPARFCPTLEVTRAEMAAFLTRAFGFEPVILIEGAEPGAGAAPGFSDTSYHVLEPEINALAAAGLTQGCAVEPLRYCPERLVTRAEAATLIARALGHDTTPPAEPEPEVEPEPEFVEPETETVDNVDTEAEAKAEAPEENDEDAAEPIEPLPFPEVQLPDAQSTNLANRLSRLEPRAPSGAEVCVTAYVEDRLVYSERSQEPMLPASLVKVVTAAAALEVMGPDATYTTTVVIPPDAEISGGTYDGDIYVIGGGDPVLASRAYMLRWHDPGAFTDVGVLADRVAAALRSRGITRITGSIIADESRYPEAERDYSTQLLTPDSEKTIWKRSYLDENQAGPLSALMLNQGWARYGNSPSRGSNVRSSDPAHRAVVQFDDLLEARGFIIRRRPGVGVAPEGSEVLASIESPALSEILKRMVGRSDNTIAEMIFKEVGFASGTGSARAQAAKAITEALDGLGLRFDRVVIADGSGLSYDNRLTCDLVSDILRLAGPGSALHASLSIVGRTGTLIRCTVNDSSAYGTVYVKTGGLNDATALAGISTAKNGEHISFAMMANGHRVGSSLGSCNTLQRYMINTTRGYPYN